MLVTPGWMPQVLIPRRNQMHVRIFKVRNLTACVSEAYCNAQGGGSGGLTS